MKIQLTTLKKVAKDKTGAKAVLCTNDLNFPVCLLFRSDLDELAKHIAKAGVHPALHKPSVRNLAYVLNEESLNGEDIVSGAILASKAFARIAKRKLTTELQFPVRQKFHFMVRW